MTDQPTDRPTNRPTDKAGCRVACTRLKNTSPSRFSPFQSSSLWYKVNKNVAFLREKKSKISCMALISRRKKDFNGKNFTLFSRVHTTLHPALSVRPSVRLSVGPSVRRSVCPSVGLSVTLYFFCNKASTLRSF